MSAWNVFVEGDEDNKTVLYRLRWVPAIGGSIRVANEVACDWRDLSLEDFARKYFRPGFSPRRRN